MSKFIKFIDLIGSKTLALFTNSKVKAKSTGKKVREKLDNIKEQSLEVETPEEKKGRIIGISIVGIIGIICIVLLFNLFSARSINDVVKEYAAVSYDMDTNVDDFIKTLPDELIDVAIDAYKFEDEMYTSTDDEILETWKNDLLSDAREDLRDLTNEIGIDWDYTYKITEKTNLAENNENYLKEYFEQFGLNGSYGYKNPTRVSVEVTFSKNGEVIETESFIIDMAKKGNDWYYLI